MTRQIILDTETTGTEASQGDRIVEIGAVEMIDRKLTGRSFHEYLNPEREMDDEVIAVHGITNEFVADKPLFKSVSQAFLDFIEGAELIIHNAPFDLSFLNMEYRRLNAKHPKFEDSYKILDSLALARKMHPGQRNSLDALCKRYGIDNSARTLHGALLDSEILADVYLAMTGGQVALFAGEAGDPFSLEAIKYEPIARKGTIPILGVKAEEAALHEGLMKLIAKKAKDTPLWQKLYPLEVIEPKRMAPAPVIKEESLAVLVPPGESKKEPEALFLDAAFESPEAEIQPEQTAMQTGMDMAQPAEEIQPEHPEPEEDTAQGALF